MLRTPAVAAPGPSPPSDLRIALLGPPAVEVDGAPLRVDTKKAVALLAYLAMSSGPQGRDALATLLWPEYDQARARAAFRRTLSALGSALGGRWITADRSSVALVRSDPWLDVAEFDSAVGGTEDDAVALEHAVGLYRGDFMAGFGVRDAPEFEDWQFFHAETYRRRFADALDRLVQQRASDGRLDDAIELARRRLAVDPLHEPAHRRLMTLFAQKGERAAALQQYRACVALLENELGVAPLEETTRLYRDVLEHRLRAEPVRVEPPPASAPPDRLPLVGRADALARAMHTYEATGPDGRIVVFSGEPGIGKTRMAEETAHAARRRGGPVIATRCHEDERRLPYAMTTAVLRAALNDRRDALASLAVPTRTEAGRLVREIAALPPASPAPSSLDDAGARVRFLEALAATLDAAVAPHGILLLDDLQWADPASVHALVYFLRRLQGRDVCVVATWRNELAPNHPLARATRDLIAQGRGAHIALDRLEPRDIDALLSAAHVDDREGAARRLMEETEGVPFFLVQYLEVLREGGDWTLPPAAGDVLAQRLGGNSEPAQQLLGAAAVIGRSFEFETLHAASGRSLEECVAGIEELVAAGVIEEVSGGAESPTYDFTHDQIRRYVYDRTSLARRRILHRRVAHALTSRHARADGPTDAVVAAHLRAAGEEQEAARFYERAAEHARSLFANDDAIENLQAALALGHPEAARLHEALGDLHTLGGDYPAAIVAYERAAALGSGDAPGPLEHKIAGVHLRRADWVAADARLHAALEHSKTQADDGARARVLADRSMVAHRLGDAAAARTIAEQALSLAESAADDAARAQSHNILGVLDSHAGRYGDAVAHLNASRAAAEASDDAGAMAAAYNNLGLAARGAGDLERALEFGERALEASRRQGDRHREAAIHNNLADTLHATGREQDAMTHLKHAARLFAAVGASGEPEPEIWKLVEW